MKLNKNLHSTLRLALLIAVIGLGLGVNYIFADWSGPPEVPPSGNIDVPVNIGKVGQYKAGALWVGTAGVTTGLVVKTGNVGIGTITPASGAGLHLVQGGEENYAAIQLGKNEAGKGMHITKTTDAGGNSLNIFSGAVGAGTKLLTILQNGNVGIGASDPTEKLHVAGNINLPATGILKINGQAGTDGQVLTRTATGMNWMDASGGGTGGDLPNGTVSQTLRHDGTNWISNSNFLNSGNGKVTINTSAGQESSINFSENNVSKYVLGKEADDDLFITNKNIGFKVLENDIGNTNSQESFTTLRGYGGVTIESQTSFSGGYGIRLKAPGGGLVVGEDGNVGIGRTDVNPSLTNNIFGVYGSNTQLGTIMFRTFEDGKYSTRFRMLTTATDYDGEGNPVGKSWNVIARADNFSGENNNLIFSFFDGTDANDNYWKEGMRLKRNGELHDLRVSGDVYARGIKLDSDLTLKENITDLPDSLEKILKLNGVNFEWKDDKTNQKNIGFIAQEVKKIFPELVKGEEGDMSVDYVSLVPVLVEAVQELNQKNEELESRLEALEEKINEISK